VTARQNYATNYSVIRKLEKKLSSARTKTEAIVVKVLAPHSVEQIIKDVQDVKYLGVATDASNHGYTKVFPVVIQYFPIEEGLNVKLLRVDDLKNEKSKTITEYLMDSLKKISYQ
jgi:mannose/fructose/N-acetylgalactosamine-specific phosphotransferase system component IIB